MNTLSPVLDDATHKHLEDWAHGPFALGGVEPRDLINTVFCFLASLDDEDRAWQLENRSWTQIYDDAAVSEVRQTLATYDAFTR